MKFEIPLQAVAKQRPRFSNGKVYTPQKTRNFENDILYFVSRENVTKIRGPISARIEVFYQKPKSISKRAIWKVTKPDVDNIAKSVLDALNGYCYVDDNQVCELYISKKYSDRSYILLTLTPIHA